MYHCMASLAGPHFQGLTKQVKSSFAIVIRVGVKKQYIVIDALKRARNMVFI